MEFHKLNIAPRRPASAPIAEEGMCQVCTIRPIAGYVLGSGQYLSRTCLRCYRSADTDTFNRAFKAHGAYKQSRS